MKRSYTNIRAGGSRALLVITLALVGSLMGEVRLVSAASGWDCSQARDIALVNGRILTMATPEQVSSIVIKDGLVVHVGPGGQEHYTPCTKVFDLKRRPPPFRDAYLPAGLRRATRYRNHCG